MNNISPKICHEKNGYKIISLIDDTIFYIVNPNGSMYFDINNTIGYVFSDLSSAIKSLDEILDTSDDDENKPIHWSKIIFAFRSIRLMPLMLMPDGVILQVNCRLKGENNRDYKAQVRDVLFDKEYAKEYIKHHLLIPLDVNANQMIQILNVLFEN